MVIWGQNRCEIFRIFYLDKQVYIRITYTHLIYNTGHNCVVFLCKDGFSFFLIISPRRFSVLLSTPPISPAKASIFTISSEATVPVTSCWSQGKNQARQSCCSSRSYPQEGPSFLHFTYFYLCVSTFCAYPFAFFWFCAYPFVFSWFCADPIACSWFFTCPFVYSWFNACPFAYFWFCTCLFVYSWFWNNVVWYELGLIWFMLVAQLLHSFVNWLVNCCVLVCLK